MTATRKRPPTTRPPATANGTAEPDDTLMVSFGHTEENYLSELLSDPDVAYFYRDHMKSAVEPVGNQSPGGDRRCLIGALAFAEAFEALRQKADGELVERG